MYFINWLIDVKIKSMQMNHGVKKYTNECSDITFLYMKSDTLLTIFFLFTVVSIIVYADGKKLLSYLLIHLYSNVKFPWTLVLYIQNIFSQEKMVFILQPKEKKKQKKRRSWILFGIVTWEIPNKKKYRTKKRNRLNSIDAVHLYTSFFLS